MGLAEIRADIQMAREQIAAAGSTDELKQQLLDNILPLMEGLIDGTRDEFGKRDEVLQAVIDDVDHLMDESDDVLQAETTTEILSVFEQGKLLANELEILLKKADEITKKRVTPIIKAYRQAAIVVGEKLAEITIPLEPDPEPEDVPIPDDGTELDGDDDEDDEDEDEDDDEDEKEDDKAAKGGEG